MPGESERASTIYTRMVKRHGFVTLIFTVSTEKACCSLWKGPREKAVQSLLPHPGLSGLPCFPWLCWHLCRKSSVWPPRSLCPATLQGHTSPCSAYSHEDDPGGWKVTAPAGWSRPPPVSLPVLVTAPPLLPFDPREAEGALGPLLPFLVPAHCVSPFGCPHLWK